MQNTERPAEEILQAEKKLPKKLWRRLLAAFMALALIAAMFLGYAAQIRFGQLQYVGTVLEHAASVTADNTEYLSESTLKRAWNILRYAVGKPKTYDEFEMYASLAIARQDFAGAIPYMQGCIDHYSGDSSWEKAVLYMRLGSLHALSDNAQSSVSAFDKAIETEPKLADAYLLRAQMNSLLGNQELVAADIRSYDALVGDDPAIRAAVGGLYESAGEYESAVKCYTLGLEQSGGTDPELLAARGRCLVLTENLGAARQDLIDFFANGGQDPTGLLYGHPRRRFAVRQGRRAGAGLSLRRPASGRPGGCLRESESRPDRGTLLLPGRQEPYPRPLSGGPQAGLK